MDPPTTSSSSSYSSQPHTTQKKSNAAAQPQNTLDDHTTVTSTTATTKTPAKQLQHLSKTNNNSRSSRAPKFHNPINQKNNQHQRARNATKIIKGEIHNVCLTMRADPRYYTNNTSTTTAAQQQRLEYYEDCHPILMGLRNLHDLLSAMEVDGMFFPSASSGDNTGGDEMKKEGKKCSPRRRKDEELTNDNSQQLLSLQTAQVTAVTFVSPFTQAVCSSDITAKTTGAALSALHKFILYGFIGCHNHDSGCYNIHNGIGLHCFGDEYHGVEEGRMVGSSSRGGGGEAVIRQSVKLIAECIRKCSFEGYSYWNDTSSNADGVSGATAHSSSSGRGVFSFWSRSANDTTNDDGANAIAPSLGKSSSDVHNKAQQHDLPSFLTLPQRQSGGKGSGSISNSSGIGTPSRKKKQSTHNKPHNHQHQDVILKLLSLSVQVLRCPAGRQHLSPQDIIGIFDTCLHVAIFIAGENDSLLRSAAADALSHCVIVVFGMRREQPQQHGGGGGGKGGYYYNGGGGVDSDEESDSDDDWGERDPTEECANDDNLSESYESDDDDEAHSQSSGVGVNKQAGDSHRLEGDESDIKAESKEDDDDELPLVPIMHRLAALSDPLIHEDETCVLALTLINIALETMSDVDALAVRYPRLLNIMQNDLCRNLLRLSTSNDLTILGLALRVIFNLFNGIKDHLKVQLEVFLTSVHLRILSFSVSPQTHERIWACSPERRELALESLLEFCREPMLMADLYLNYDCDMNCTNLFETICSTLSKIANPERSQQTAIGSSNDDEDADSIGDFADKPKTMITTTNRLALEGILAVIDAIARKCRSSSKFNIGASDIDPAHDDDNPLPLPSPPDSGNSDFLGNTLYIRSDSLNESFELNGDRNHSDAESGIEWSVAQNILRERKIQKRRLAKAATEFNERSRDKEWIKEAERVGVLPTPATPSSVASFLFSTPKLDKAKIGLYLSKGPKDKYPFHNDVLGEFASLFDFDGMSFSDALRSFLSRFRLPGEAQCIDRLMESFANRLYEVSQSSASGNDDDQAVEKSMLEPPCTNDESDNNRSGTLDPPAASEEEADTFPFKSADAAYVLSFSTIMLNTDLHNPNMKDEKRMTLEQFIRNNRGINDGDDLPPDFLTNLYYEIKNNEIQVKQDLLQDGVNNFDGLIADSSGVAQPFFTSSNVAHHSLSQAGIHERDMFVSISAAAIDAISAVYVDSWDDALVIKSLDGLQNCAFVAVYFGLGSIFNQVLEMILGFGYDYVTSVASFMYSEVGTGKEFGRVELALAARGIPPLPQSFLRKFKQDTRRRRILHDVMDVDGSAAHRGLLSLDCALALARDHIAAVDDAWPVFLDVIFALREVEALPASLSDLDDFADSKGNALRPSKFARDCEDRVSGYRESLAPVRSEGKGFWRSVFGPSLSSTEPSNHRGMEEFPMHEALANITDAAQLDDIIAKTDDIEFAKRILFALFDAIIPGADSAEALSDPLFESNAVFVLELSARFLISNRNSAAELYSIFLSKFELLLSPTQDKDSREQSILGLKFPYILERVIVTILRSCIHFFDIENSQLREALNRSLRLLTQLPSDYLREVSDRLGCGSAIILRGCFFLFGERAEDWSTIKCLLDLAAQDKSGRGFVFDGIASVIDSIDYTLPSIEEGNDCNELQLSQCGVEVIASLLLRYRDGSYEGDLSFRIPAMSYITKVYSYSQHFGTSDEGSSDASVEKETKLQEYEFHTMVTAIYKDACLSPDDNVAKRGFESLAGIVLSTKVDSIPVGKWIDFLEMVASNPPGISQHSARISSLELIGRLFLTLMPELSNEKENWAQLEDFTISSALVVNENLRAGRATALFETTVETVTNVVNVLSMAKQMSMANAQGESFCAWVSETLLYELEQVGACGGVTNGR